MSTLLDTFCEWFEGKFDNWEQASSNPSKWAHIYVVHKKISDRQFETTSRYNYQTEPYRKQIVTIRQDDDLIIVENPACDLVFMKLEDHFVGKSTPGCKWKDHDLESSVKLYPNQYHSWDKGYWQSSEGFFTFYKRL